MINLKKAAIVGAVLFSPFILAACKTNQTTGVNNQSTETTTSEQNTSNAALGTTIDYTDKGFSPAELRVKAGEKVEFKNSSSKTVQVNSNPHPTHTLFAELNIGAIAAGQTKSVTFTKAGTYSYHNHLNASQGGTIVVE